MWNDITVIFSQTLSDPKYARVLKEAQSYATGLHMSSDKYTVGKTVVPSSDPNWNYNDPEHNWERDHFLICVNTGLKAAQHKVISYAQGSAVTQKPNKNPTYQSGLRLLQGTDDFKGQIPVPVCIRHQDKVTTATAGGPCCLFSPATRL